ncbi:hypothetical protein Y032_0023g857 [Ancylostoma ceylanicum]|uniref:Uncharacterized protein n=1 Tax=Ancylostoma ceylanicum TaxID=53326 RepID=A0A016UYL1_9BILA|nr:hypothetical protein Y032_0023g857 [Ancylostoma ceylanicum]
MDPFEQADQQSQFILNEQNALHRFTVAIFGYLHITLYNIVGLSDVVLRRVILFVALDIEAKTRRLPVRRRDTPNPCPEKQPRIACRLICPLVSASSALGARFIPS